MSTTDQEKSRNDSGPGSEGDSSEGTSFRGGSYEICIGARLDSSWSDWFEGLEMRPQGENRTILSGRVPDQAALLGILNKVSRLNVPLISVNEVEGSRGDGDTNQEGGE